MCHLNIWGFDNDERGTHRIAAIGETERCYLAIERLGDRWHQGQARRALRGLHTFSACYGAPLTAAVKFNREVQRVAAIRSRVQ